VLRFCKAELLEKNFFHAVLEAAKSVFERLRSMTALTSDGAALADAALSSIASGVPLLAINSLQTESEQSEQKGFVNLLKGIAGMVRNVHAHAPRISWAIEEVDALDVLTTISFIHRRLDQAVPTRPR
jgi:uncharacterized protein (TIGR02391 family)